ncbi:MAG TPA: pyridoxamine 5'-phosphate oxidase family protein, partial [Dehalococcoidia bacterium]|nr:pyridoxamine 5'-phosphate oxidase family protein [Dehalococcoidia bacterium]
WFVPFRGRVYMTTRSANPTVRDLLRNPEVALLFDGDGGRRKGRVLRIRGRATFRTERRICAPIYALAAARYYLSPGGIVNTVKNRSKFSVRTRYYTERAGEGGVIEVTPKSAEFLKAPT